MSKIIIPWAKPTVGKEELNEIVDSFNADWLTMGPKVEEFENKMAEYLNVPFAIAVSNGTVALDIALKTIGINYRDEVIVPALTYFSTASSVSYQNATPVFVDIEKNSLNINVDEIEKAITKKTKAIIFIDYGGSPSNYDKIAELGYKYNLFVLQDGAQSLGAKYKGNPVGAQAEISTMSFHMAKIMTCVEGGMIFTHNEKYKDEIITRRNIGESKGQKYIHLTLGTNARMTDLQAAIGLAQFSKLSYMLEERKRVANQYDKLFQETDIQLAFNNKNKSYENANFFYAIMISNRDKIANNLKNKHGIDTRIAYPLPLYKQPVYYSGDCKSKHMNCPITEQVTSSILNLPIFPEMSNDMVKIVVDAIIAEQEIIRTKQN